MQEFWPIDTETNEKAISGKELAPAGIDERAIGLDAIDDPDVPRVVFLAQLNRTLIKLQACHERLTRVPDEFNVSLNKVALQNLRDCSV